MKESGKVSNNEEPTFQNLCFLLWEFWNRLWENAEFYLKSVVDFGSNPQPVVGHLKTAR